MNTAIIIPILPYKHAPFILEICIWDTPPAFNTGRVSLDLTLVLFN